MENENTWKQAIWRISRGKAQAKRILRVAEVKAIIKNINPDEQGFYKIMETTKKNAQLWFYALTYTGMRLSELIRLKETPVYGKEDLINYNQGTIWLPLALFGTKGKQKIINQERTVYLSFKGRKLLREFMDTAYIPKMKSGSYRVELLPNVFDAMLKGSAKRIGLPTRKFDRTIKQYSKDAFGAVIYDANGKPVYKKVQVPMKEETAGVFVRSFRATWESWITSRFMSDPRQILNIVGSMGHERATAESFYITSGQFDDDDLKDIKDVTEGWNIRGPEKESDESNEMNKSKE